MNSGQLLVYVLICAYLFALLDWKVVQFTRFTRPDLMERMHAYERSYAILTRTVELVLCAPAVALKPIFYEAFLDVEASGNEQEVIVHAPKPDWRGFYVLPKRGEGYVFVSWFAWAIYWIVPSLVWLIVVSCLLSTFR